jgi:transposase-like protein
MNPNCLPTRPAGGGPWRSAVETAPPCRPANSRRPSQDDKTGAVKMAQRAMQRFQSMKTLQKFSSVHAQVHNHFNQERHLVARQLYKRRRAAALAEWRALA